MSEKEQKKFFTIQNMGYLTVMGVLFLILGLIISTQTKKHILAERSLLPVERQLNGLVALLKETQSKKAELEKQVTKLRQKERIINREALSEDRFKTLYQIAGLTTASGEGIIIKLEDRNTKKILKSTDLLDNDGLIHSDDLLKIVNELKAAGAKAIAINNQRLVTISEISTAGNSILVNQARLNPPYVIRAIGPIKMMISALKMRGGIVEYLEVFGIKVSIETKTNIKIPAYNKPLA